MDTLNEFIREWGNDKPYILANTSGSTGEPKEIRLLKSDMILSAQATNNFFYINDKSVLGIPLSLNYIAGKMMVVRAIQAKCRILELPVKNEITINTHIDLLSVVPSQLNSLLKLENTYQFVRNILIGGAPLPPLMEKEIMQSKLNAWHGYGMTETCSHIALRHIGSDKSYHAMPNIYFETDNRDCLVIISRKFSWKRLVTNDIVELISDKDFRWIGRIDNMINSGGIKLYPEKLEHLFAEQIPTICPFYLTSEPDEVLGQRLVMIAEKPHENLIGELRSKFVDHKILPKRIISVNRLPKTTNGKIKRLSPELIK